MSLPIYDSLSQCASATHIPLSVLKKAKRSGCDAFVSNRVRLDRLLKYLFSKPDDSGIDWGAEFKKEQAKTQRLKRELMDRSLVPVSEVVEYLSAVVSNFRDTARQKIVNEGPARVAPERMAEARIEMEKLWRECLSSFVASVEAKCAALEKEGK